MYLLSQQLKLMRVRRGWTQKRLASQTQLSQTTICRMEIDCRKVQVDYLLRVLHCLGNDQATDQWPTDTLFQKYLLAFLGFKQQLLFNQLKVSEQVKNVLLTCLELMENLNFLILNQTKSKVK